MKTTNLMPWCNLFSTASKYNICIKPSRYRNLLFLAASVFFSLLLISYTTYAYQFVLVIAVITITIMSILIAKQRNEQLTRFQVIVNENGVCLFEYMLENTDECTVNSKESFQLLTSSRYSFFGCWLYMVPLSNLSSSGFLPNTINKNRKKRLFIYRDSLSAENFSRLAQIIRKLKKTS